MTIVNLVTPKAGAKREILFNKPNIGAYSVKVSRVCSSRGLYYKTFTDVIYGFL
jgi:hypothetical protein